jgi:septum formation protein
MIEPVAVPPQPVPRLVLASGSPRRRLLLAMAGFEFDVMAPHVDETPHTGEDPERMVVRLAEAKTAAVRSAVGDGSWALACDTTVVRDGEIVGKPGSADEAVEILLSLAGRDHEVVTGFAIGGADDDPEVGSVWSTVTMRPISRAEAAAYAAGGEPLDKAGAYGLQGEGGRFVVAVEGSRSNVVGLPLEAVVPLLVARGIPRRSGAADTW